MKYFSKKGVFFTNGFVLKYRFLPCSFCGNQQRRYLISKVRETMKEYKYCFKKCECK